MRLVNPLPLLLFTLLLIAPATASFAETILKASHQWNTKDVRHTMVKIIADEVNKANVGLKVQIYPKKTLYKPRKQWTPLTTGELALSAFPLAYAADKHPEFDITLMPGLVKNHDHASQLNNSKYMKQIKSIINRAGVIVIADTWLAGGFVSNERCILEPKDIRGLSARAAGKTFSLMLAGAGAKIKSMSSADIYKNLKNDTLQAANTSSGSFVSYKIYEQSKCLTIPGKNALWFMYEPILMSKKIFSRLNTRQKNAILSAGKKAENYFKTKARDLDNTLVETFKSKGVKVVEMSESQAAKWRAIAKKTSYADFARRVPNGKALIASAQGEFQLWTSNIKLTPHEQAKQNTNKNTVRIITGGISGTSTTFAMDMASVLNAREGNGLRILPIISTWGEQSLRDILFLQGVDMGITHSAYMNSLRRSDPRLFQNIRNNVKYITKLYNAELHVIARKNIRSLKDLTGKRVNFAEPVNSKGLTAKAILKSFGIQVNAFHMDTKLALQKVITGELDAVTIIDGAPIQIIKNLPKNSDIHFVPIDLESELSNDLLPANLKNEHYPNLIGQGESVSTLSTSVVLAVYNWSKKSPRYEKLEIFVNKLFSQVSDFQNNARHGKWANINVAASVPGWDRFGPAKEFLRNLAYGAQDTAETDDDNGNTEQNDPTFDEFRLWMSKNRYGNASEAEMTQLFKKFQEFHRWRSKNGE
ncbi:MAG: TRAP transporter substrate-binding protein DctP [Methyloligellaceae bacterium]